MKNILTTHDSGYACCSPQVHKSSSTALAFSFLISTFANAAVEVELIPMTYFVSDEVKRTAAGNGAGLLITQDVIPLIINNSGKYSLGQDVSFTPNGDNQAAITVNANNVTLELNDHTITQVNTGNAGCIGIQVNGGFKDITVRNGTIQNFSAVGVSVQQGCSEISLSNLLTQSIGYASGTLTPAGVAISQANTTEFGGVLLAFQGTHSLCEGIIIDNVAAEQIFNFEKKSPVTGIVIVQAQNVIIDHCLTNNMLATGKALGGVVIFTCTNVLIQNSVVSDNQAIGLPVANPATGGQGLMFGFIVGSRSRNVTIKNCVASGNRGNSTMIGFEMSNGSQDFVVENCIAQDSLLFNPGFSIGGRVRSGFDQLGATRGVFENCKALREQIGFTASLQGGTVPASEVIFKNCHAVGLAPELTPTGEGSAGFSIPAGSFGVIVDSCIAENFHVFSPTPSTFGAGFALNGGTDLLVINCEARNCDFGILETGAAARNLIKYNEIYNCVSGVEAVKTGSSLYIGNIAYLNTATNFQKLPSGTPVRTWSLSKGSPPNALNDFGLNPTDWLDNLNVI